MTNQEGLRDLHKLIAHAAHAVSAAYRSLHKTEGVEARESLVKIVHHAASVICLADDSIDEIETVEEGGTPADEQQVCYVVMTQYL